MSGCQGDASVKGVSECQGDGSLVMSGGRFSCHIVSLLPIELIDMPTLGLSA